jgi:hypothetical protein
MVNQAKLKSFNTASKYKYGYEIPRTYEQAKRLDQKNGNTKWGDATVLELGQIDEYTTFIDKGHHTKVITPRSSHQGHHTKVITPRSSHQGHPTKWI